jgi:hypothetical protein
MDKNPVGRPRKYKTRNARFRAYRLRQKQIGILLVFEHPETAPAEILMNSKLMSLPSAVQHAEAVRLLLGKKPCIAPAKARKIFAERIKAELAKVGLA